MRIYMTPTRIRTRRRSFTKKKQHNPMLAQHLLSKTEGHCWFCGIDLAAEDVSIDHLHPLRQGGNNDTDNLVACCPPCNVAKGARTLEQYRRRVWARGMPRPRFYGEESQ